MMILMGGPFSFLGAQAVMRPTYVQLCSRADRVPGMGSNAMGVPPTTPLSA